MKFLFTFLLILLIYLEPLSAQLRKAGATVIPPSWVSQEKLKIPVHTFGSLFHPEKSRRIPGPVADYGMWMFVEGDDTTRLQLGFFASEGKSVDYSMICWKRPDSVSWRTPFFDFDSPEETGKTKEPAYACMDFLAYIRSHSSSHLGWATQVPIEETPALREEMRTLLHEKWQQNPDSTQPEVEYGEFLDDYLPVLFHVLLYQEYYNSPWLKELIGARLRQDALDLHEKGVHIKLTFGAILGGPLPGDLRIERSSHFLIICTDLIDTCMTAYSPASPMEEALAEFDQIVKGLNEGEEPTLPPWCK